MNRKALITAIAITAAALLALLAYSWERSYWLFARFEQQTEFAVAAAVVVELAAVALIVGAGALAGLDRSARAWANRALLGVLSVQSIANLSAGYLRGGRTTLALFGATDNLAAYAVTATLWLATNLAVPWLVLCLSKLLERLVTAYVTSSTAEAAPELADLRNTLAATTQDLANRDAELATVVADAAQARKQLANNDTELRTLRAQIETLRSEAAITRSRPSTHADIVAYVRERIANQDCSMLELSRELGFGESTLRMWVKNAAHSQHTNGRN